MRISLETMARINHLESEMADTDFVWLDEGLAQRIFGLAFRLGATEVQMVQRLVNLCPRPDFLVLVAVTPDLARRRTKARGDKAEFSQVGHAELASQVAMQFRKAGVPLVEVDGSLPVADQVARISLTVARP